MYPHRELIRLAAHKAALRRTINFRRTACAAAATRVLQPVVWLDRLLALWRRIAPFAPMAAVPLLLLFRRSPAVRPRLLGTLLRWAAVLFGVVRASSAQHPITPAPPGR